MWKFNLHMYVIFVVPFVAYWQKGHVNRMFETDRKIKQKCIFINVSLIT
jgi:hypothetical protein